MIKWICDICGKEIEKPECPDYVNVYLEGKARDHETSGWGESREIIKLCCHRDCAKKIAEAIKKATDEVVRAKQDISREV
jgi:nitrate reductase assembly molybdenum cofactor insertion protein NarJ